MFKEEDFIIYFFLEEKFSSTLVSFSIWDDDIIDILYIFHSNFSIFFIFQQKSKFLFSFYSWKFSKQKERKFIMFKFFFWYCCCDVLLLHFHRKHINWFVVLEIKFNLFSILCIFKFYVFLSYFSETFCYCIVF